MDKSESPSMLMEDSCEQKDSCMREDSLADRSAAPSQISLDSTLF